MTGTLGRVGSTWVLTLTRIDRSTLVVLAREQVQRTADEADVVLADVPAAVHRLLGHPDPSSLPLVGASAAGVGAAVAGSGGALLLWSGAIFQDGLTALNAGDRKRAAQKRVDGEGLYDLGWGCVAVGATVAAVGGAILIFNAAGDP